MSEKVGESIISAVTFAKLRREAGRDRKLGEAAAVKREGKVEKGRVRIEEHEPVMIVPPVVTPAKSERVEKERQVPLFTDLPGDSTLPPISLLDAAPAAQETISADTLEFTSRLIEKKLKDFGVEVSVVAAYPGPVVTRYEIEPATGVKGSQIVGLAKDLARSLSLVSIRVVETIPGKNFMALELPNQRRQTVQSVGDSRLGGLCRRGFAAHHGPRQGHRRQAGVRRPREDAALAGGRHDRLGQVGGYQRDDPVAALQGRAPTRSA